MKLLEEGMDDEMDERGKKRLDEIFNITLFRKHLERIYIGRLILLIDSIRYYRQLCHENDYTNDSTKVITQMSTRK